MYCKRCGQKLNDDLKLCPKCGNPMNIRVTDEEKNTKKKFRKKLFVAIAVVIVTVVAGVALFFVSKEQKEKKQYVTCLDTGNKYLEEMDYEKAEDIYLKAIEIRPKEKEPYMKLADIYMAQEKQDKATEILKKAVDHVDEKNSEDVVERYNLYSYVDEVLIPQLGRCEENVYECNYENRSGGGFYLEPVQAGTGVMNWKIADYDGDGTEELLVLLLDDKKQIDSNDIQRNGIILNMYANEGKKVVLKDQYEGLEPVLGYGDEEDDGIFLKANENRIYICGSSYSLISTFADGATVKSFILSYKDGKFIEETGLNKATASSVPTEYAEIVEQMSRITEKLGLNNETEQLQTNGWPRFVFNDTVDKTLIRITGHNEGFNATQFYRDGLPEYLGKVVIELKYGELNSTKDESSQETFTETKAEENDITQSKITNLTGDWTIDTEMTQANNSEALQQVFGTSIQYGYNLSFGEDGSFSWYIATWDGSGAYTVNGNVITGICTASSETTQKTMTMRMVNEEITMEMSDIDSELKYTIYWKKK